MPTDKRMTGPRKWRFTSGLDVLSLDQTDFRVEYAADYQDSGAVLGIVLRAIWEHVDFALAAGLARRVALEDRLKQLTWDFVGKRGTLEVDYGLPSARSFAGVVMKSPALGEASNNALLTYDLTWEYPLGAAQQIARLLSFGGKNLSAKNFIVEYSKDDGTVFKEVFRAAPIRVPVGPGLKHIKVTAIRQAVTGGTPLEKRQLAEAYLKDWAWNYKGSQGTLILDGDNNLGTCHCLDVRASDLSLPDALTFELEFVTGYGS